MSTHLSGTRAVLVAGALRRTFTLVIGLVAGSAGAQTTSSDLTVHVFADHFVVANRSLGDLDRLADVVAARRPNAITLSVCGPDVSRPLMAAAHRFRNLPLRISVLAAGEPGCPAAPNMTASARRVQLGSVDINDNKVDLYWQGLMP